MCLYLPAQSRFIPLQIYTFPPDKIINSTSFHSQKHPGLDDKLYGHSTYLFFTNSVTACVGTTRRLLSVPTLSLGVHFFLFSASSAFLLSWSPSGLPQLTTSQKELFLSLPSNHHLCLYLCTAHFLLPHR